MARVYVSSTFEDLEEYRAEVREALLTMGHEVVAMETYGARDDRPVDLCLRDVAACDLYVGIAAWRYGSVPDDHDYSITELEYRQAVASGKPRLVFLAEKAGWPFDRVEVDALARVNAFREELGKNRVVKTFTSAAELRGRVGEAVANWEREQGLAPAKARTDWEKYRQAVVEKHRWVNLEVIAGPEQDRIIRIPLTEVFVAQQTAAGRPAFDVLDDPGTSVLREPSTEVIGREPKQVILGGPGSGKSTLFHRVMLTLCDPERSDQPVPLLIELRQYSLKRSRREVGDFIEYLVAQASASLRK